MWKMRWAPACLVSAVVLLGLACSPSPSGPNDPAPAADLASTEPVDLHPVGDPIAVYRTGNWDTWGIREPGAAIYDPATDSWICTYSGRGNIVDGNSAVTSSIGALVSTDGETWEPHPQNPLTGDDQGEDPYLAKDAATGNVWRDSSGRALLFAEEKDFDLHRGIEMWRSAPDSLSDWTLYGRVVDRGDDGAWDATDRTSPTVVHDGTRLVLLYEGRNMPAGQEGRVGIAFSTDEGESWTVRPDPIVSKGLPGTWNDNSIVPDDLIKVGGVWIMLAHGQLGGLWTVGRYLATDHPADWTAGSFVEFADNPLSKATDTVMAWGNDPRQGLQITGDGQRLERVVVQPRPAGTRTG